MKSKNSKPRIVGNPYSVGNKNIARSGTKRFTFVFDAIVDGVTNSLVRAWRETTEPKAIQRLKAYYFRHGGYTLVIHDCNFIQGSAT